MKDILPAIFCLVTVGLVQAQTPGDQASYHKEKADRFVADKMFDSAATFYQRAAELYSQASDHREILRSISNAGKAMIAMRKIDPAISLLLKYEPIAGKVDSLDEARELFFTTLSELYYYAGDAFNSLKYRQPVYEINIARSNTAPDDLINITRIMGVLHGNSGQLIKAVTYYRKYAELITAHHGPEYLLMSDAYNYLGVMYRHMGEYDMALDYYKKSIEVGERYTAEERNAIAPRFRSMAPVYNNIGTLYHHLHDDENALKYTLRALSLYENEKSTGKTSLATIMGGLGTTYTRLGRYDEALKFEERALALFRDEYGDKHGRVATELKNIGDTWFALKDYNKASDFYRQSLEMNLDVHGPFHPNTGEAFIKMADVEEINGNLTTALGYTQSALRSVVHNFNSDNIRDNPTIDAACNVKVHLIRHLSRKADILMKQFERTKDRDMLHLANETYALTVQFSENVRNDLLDIRSKSFLAENSKSLYERSIRAALLLRDVSGDATLDNVAFAMMEKNKSRLLLESLQTSQVKGALSSEDELFNTENGLLSRVAYYQEQLLDERIKGEKQDSLKINQWQAGVFETRRELESFKLKLRTDHPRYFHAKYAAPEISIAALKRELAPDQLFIEFFSGDSALYVFYATPKNSGIISLQNDVVHEFQEMVSGLRNRDSDAFLRVAYPLYTKILEPALQACGTTPERIVVVPDGILAYIPFELLLTTPPGDRKFRDLEYAIRKFNFSYRLSAALMLDGRALSRGKSNNDFAGFAPQFEGQAVAQRGLPGNIPYALREVEEISGSFPGTVFLGDDATESNFRAQAHRAGVIHLATHAALDEYNADLSRLYFSAGDSLEDGLLHAYEIFNLNMSAKLVALSACNTGAGVYREGEGVMSLSRAFAYAGCESMLTSLWPSQDQTTADIMAGFYRNLAKGLPKDEALRQAKLDFLATSDNIKSDPFFWAGFVLIGNTEPLSGKNNFITGATISVLVFSVIAIILLRRRNAKRAASAAGAI